MFPIVVLPVPLKWVELYPPFHLDGRNRPLHGILGRETAAHGVLGDAAGEQKLKQKIGAAGLGADPRELEPAEWLAVDGRPGDPAVDVEIADAEGAADLVDVRRAAGIE